MAYAGMGFGGFKMPDITIAKDFATLEYMEAQKDALGKKSGAGYNAFAMKESVDPELVDANGRSYVSATSLGINLATVRGQDPEAVMNIIGSSYKAGVNQASEAFAATRGFEGKVFDPNGAMLTRENMRLVEQDQKYRAAYAQGSFEVLPNGSGYWKLPLGAGLDLFALGMPEQNLIPIDASGRPVEVQGNKLPDNVVGFAAPQMVPPSLSKEPTFRSAWRDGAKRVAETAGKRTTGGTTKIEGSSGVTITTGGQVAIVEKQNLMTLATNSMFKGANGATFSLGENKEAAGMIKEWGTIMDLTPVGRDAFEEITAEGGIFGNKYSSKVWSDLSADEKAEVGAEMYASMLAEAGAQVDYSEIENYSRTIQENSNAKKRSKLVITDQEIKVGETEFTLKNPIIDGKKVGNNMVFNSIDSAITGEGAAPIDEGSKVIYVGKFDKTASGVSAVKFGNDSTKQIEINSFGIILKPDGNYDIAFKGSVMSGTIPGAATADVGAVNRNIDRFTNEAEVNVTSGAGARADFNYVSFERSSQQVRDVFSSLLSENTFQNTGEFIQYVLELKGIKPSTETAQEAPDVDPAISNAQSEVDSIFSVSE